MKLKPLPEVSRGLVLAGSGAERLREGTVLSVGPGKWTEGVWEKGTWKHPPKRSPVGVEPGDTVFFWREHLEHQQGKQVTRVLLQECEDDVGLIRAPDVLWAE